MGMQEIFMLGVLTGVGITALYHGAMWVGMEYGKRRYIRNLEKKGM